MTIGVLNGEGIGAEVIGAALRVAHAIRARFRLEFQFEVGGSIGFEAKKKYETELSAEVIDFCTRIKSQKGAILSGPGGGRYVYDLRREFRLFSKVNPLQSFPELAGASRLKPSAQPPVNILIVRENLEGLYQGTTEQVFDENGSRLAHTFHCSESNVRKLLQHACRFAVARSGRVTVVVKRGPLPAMSALWEDCAKEIFDRKGLDHTVIDIDFAAYQLLHHPSLFDVIASPNCFGDILADLGGLFFGSRGLTYGASYAEEGFGVYQTNHGCAFDLAGTDRANPVGQIFSLAMLLRESFLLPEAADAMIGAVRSVWAGGWRTADLQEPATRVIGTEAFTDKIIESIQAGARVDGE